MTQPYETEEKVRAMELWISNLLRGGVAVSLLLIVLGTTLTFSLHPGYSSENVSLHYLMTPGAAPVKSLRQLLSALQQGHGQAVVTVGLWVLIATPILRVAISALSFWQQRDKTFTVITLGVFGLLLLSLVLGRVGG